MSVMAGGGAQTVLQKRAHSLKATGSTNNQPLREMVDLAFLKSLKGLLSVSGPPWP